MGQMKTPGVYIVEKNAFPNSVVEVATAVPAFIGYTERAENGGKTLTNKPWRITSMAEYINYFGGAPIPSFSINEKADTDPEADFTAQDKEYVLKQEGNQYLLYNSMLMFFQNGGGPCYVVSIGSYKDDIDPEKMTAGIGTLIKEQEPTMVVVPEAIRLERASCQKVQQAAVMHCGNKMKNRFAILDVFEGFKERSDPSGDVVINFREDIGTNHLDFAAAYYPWINTSVINDSDLSYLNIENKDVLQALIKAELNVPDAPADGDPPKVAQLIEVIGNIAKEKIVEDDDAKDALAKTTLNKTLIQLSPLFNIIFKEVKNKLNLMPPSAAMAGIYSMVDNDRGVWKAPANVSINGVVSPALNITHDDQEDLNVDLHGKSINAIRSFVGEGTLVWGARTLDGNSQDWRYVNVRRTMIMLEESIKIATKAYVFEPNVANTWVSVKSMINNFLKGIWKRGGLAGASPDDAYSVHVGLGETMTPNDILDGIMRVTVLVAITRPAEFIEITFQQQMQKS